MRIPITKPYITEREYELVRETLDSGWLVQGPRVREFEQMIAGYTGARHAIAVNSCTSGQMLMSEIIELQPGEEVIVPAFTWISTANAVEYKGARPVFCDISLDDFNIKASEIEPRLTTKTRAVYPVSLFGLPADMPAINKIARDHRLRVVEDIACSLGGWIGPTHCGCFGDAGVLSFHPRKSITTGEGGMIITNDDKIEKMARSLREHGATISDHDRHNQSKSYRMSEYPYLGYNMRLTDIQAAIGMAQCEKLEDILTEKFRLANEFKENLGMLSWLRLPETPHHYTHGFQTYCTLFKPQETFDAIEHNDQRMLDHLHEQRNAVMEELSKQGVMTRPGTHALHIQQLYQKKYGYHKMDFPRAYAADRLSIALPFYPTMTQKEKDYLFKQLHKISP